MIIDIGTNSINLKGHNLESYQISQLKSWQFSSVSKSELLYRGDHYLKVLIKTISYLTKEQVDFIKTPECDSILKSISDNNNSYETLWQKARNFKAGNYDEKEFAEFESYLRLNLSRKLKPHQLKAAFHLYITGNGANFSVPGSGKTSVVLSVYEKLRSEEKVNVMFVVGPPACFGPWKNEFVETLGREPFYKILAGGDRISRKEEYFANRDTKAEMYLTTFQTLINDQQEINTLFSQNGIKVFLIIDEAHYIKQINGNWANGVLNISSNCKYRCVLTGTPLPKGFSDIYNLFDFLWPENEVIDSRSRILLQSLEKRGMIEEAKHILEGTVSPLFYRVRKKDLNLKAAVFHPPIIVPMNKYEETIYQAIENKIRNYQLGDYLKNIDFINTLKKGRIIRLRQCVSYISLLENVVEDYDEDLLNEDLDLRSIVKHYDSREVPAKLEHLAQMLKKFGDQKLKVVIWSNFVGTIEKLEKYIRSNLGRHCRSIYGKTPIEQSSISEELTREQIRDEFVDPKSGLDILIANPAACSESISLHKTCFNAIYYDLTYNCAQYIQSLDRIHRVGGSENTVANYYFLQYDNSIDQDILANVRRKAETMNRIIDDDYEIYSLDMFQDTTQDTDDINAYDRLFGTK